MNTMWTVFALLWFAKTILNVASHEYSAAFTSAAALKLKLSEAAVVRLAVEQLKLTRNV